MFKKKNVNSNIFIYEMSVVVFFVFFFSLRNFLAAPLTQSGGTPVCRGTHFEKGCFRQWSVFKISV